MPAHFNRNIQYLMTEYYFAKTQLAHGHVLKKIRAPAFPEQQCKGYETRVSTARPFMECNAAEMSSSCPVYFAAHQEIRRPQSQLNNIGGAKTKQ